jgi:hypothetical protein
MKEHDDLESFTDAASAEGASVPEDAHSTQREPDPPSVPTPGDKTALLHELVATIRASVAPGVSPEARAAGATACRAILTALEAQVGQPLGAAPSGPMAARGVPELASPLARILSQFTAMPREQLTGLLSQLAAMPREQLIEFLVNRLRNALPPRTPTRVSAGPGFT